jgi:hypothetical protein
MCAFALIMVLWMTGLTIAVVHGQQTPVNNTVVAATMDEAIPDEVPPETETVEPTECTTAPASTVEPSIPVIEETKPTEPEPTQSTTKKPSGDKKPSSSTSNKTEGTKKPSNNNSTATKDSADKNKMSETEMLACVIYQEVGGSKHCDECRRRVADVVLNRVADDRFPDTIEGVLTAKNQYGRFYYTGIKWADRHTWPGEKKAVERAWLIAKEVMAGEHSDLYGNGYVWQAGFKQGTSGFWCCGHYFAKGKA